MPRFKDIFRLPNITGKRLQVIAFTVLMLALGAGVYFAIHLSNQTDYFNDRNFRQLNGLSGQIASRVVDLKSGFSSSVKTTLSGEAGYEDSLNTIEGIEFSEVKKPEKEPDYANTEFSAPDCKIALLRDRGAQLLEIKCRVEQIGQQPDTAKPAPLEFSAQTQFAKLIQPFLSPALSVGHRTSEHEEGFDGVIIASLESDADHSVNAGDVIFDQGGSELAVTSLNNLKYSGNNDKKLEFASFGQTTNSADIELGGADYRLYGQPLELNTSNAGSHWVICALVQSSHLRHQTWAVSYTTVVVLAFLAALVPLSWPFLKIIFIGPKDRLRLADVYFAWFSLVVCAALMTFFILWTYMYRRYEGELDHQLGVLSENIAENMRGEVSAVISEIEILNSRKDNGLRPYQEKGDQTIVQQKQPVPIVVNNPPNANGPDVITEGKGKHKTETVQRTRILQDIFSRPECLRTGADCLQQEPYPYFSIIFWVDENGEQKTKWLVNATMTNRHSVKDRSYFTEIVNDRALKLDNQQFWISPKSSSVTGAKTVVISQPLRQTSSASVNGPTGASQPVPNGVVVMATHLSSVMDAITPPGFGYRIIDNEGEVQLQSAEARLWKENFFEECGNDRMLRSIVAARVRQHLEVDYKGRTHSLMIAPVDWSPGWSLIVFRDKQPLRTLYLQVLTLAAALFLFYMVILLVVFAVFYLVRTSANRRDEWIWPSPNSLKTYYRSIVVTLLFCAAALIWILVTKGGWTVLWVSVTAFVGIAGFLLRLKRGWVSQTVNLVAQEMRIERSFGYARAYIANLVLLVVLVGILPSIAFFKVAYESEMLLFIRHTQIKLAQGLKDRERRITDQYSARRAVDNPGPFLLANEKLANSIIDKRKREPNDVYGAFLYGTHFDYGTGSGIQDDCGKSVKGASLGPVQRFFASLVPFYNQTSVELLEFTSDCSDDNSWRWFGATDLTLQVPKNPNRGESTLYVQTPLSQYKRPSLWTPSSLLLILAFMLLLSVLLLLTRFIVRKVYLLDFEERSFKLVRADSLAGASENLLVVLNARGFSVTSLPRNGNLHWIDLQQMPVPLDGFESKIPPTARAIVVDHFEHGITDLSVGGQALDLVERLLSGGLCVVLLSAEEPSAYRWTQLPSNDIHIEDRWAELAGRFTKVYFTESCCRDEFEHNLSEAELKFKSDASLTRSQKKLIQRSIDILRDECSPRLALRRIGNEFLKRLKPESAKPAELLRQIGDQAKLYYQRVWDSQSADEKLTILHLAEDRLLSPNDPHIKQLFLKGIIVRSPDVRLFNDTFRDFVLSHCFTGALASIETQAKQKSPWESLKLPLLIALGAVLLFLAITQRDFFGSSLSIIAGLTTGIPTVFKLLGFLQSQGGAQKVLNSAANQLTT